MTDINEYFMNKWYYDNIYKKHQHKQSLLWVDDLRGIPNNYIGEYNVKIAHNYKEAIYALNNITFDIICLDHDLGEEKTGYDICKYMLEHKIRCKEVRIHTRNPVGRQNMIQLLRHYGYYVTYI